MLTSIVQTSKNVTLVGAGDVNTGLLNDALAFAPYVIAADGGAQLALNCGITPKLVIGDFDSIDKTVLEKFPENQRILISEQNSTDLEKCLRGINSPLILGVGFLGQRVDHELAAFNALVKYSQQTCVLIGQHDLVLHVKSRIKLRLKPGTRISLFPMNPTRGESSGLKWPIDGLKFSPDGKIGTSNEVAENHVSLKFFNPGMLVILPRAALGSVVTALAGQ